MQNDGSEDLADARGLLESLMGGCSAGTRVANIDTRGNVYPCQFARADEFLIGNVRDRPFSGIWADGKNPVLARFREKEARFGGSAERAATLSSAGVGAGSGPMRGRGIFWQRIPSVLYREMEILTLRESKPYTGPFSIFGIRVLSMSWAKPPII